jgi:hypothetical protein
MAQFGFILLILTVLAVPLIVAKLDREKLVLAVWLLFTFLLTRGPAIGVYVPTDRMLSYLAIPASLAAVLLLHGFLEHRMIATRLRSALIFAISVCLILALALNLNDARGWAGVRKDQLSAGEWLNRNMQPDAVAISFGPFLVNIGANRYAQQSSRPLEAVRGPNKIRNATFEVRKDKPSEEFVAWEKGSLSPDSTINPAVGGINSDSCVRICTNTAAPDSDAMIITSDFMAVDIAEPYEVSLYVKSDTDSTTADLEFIISCYNQAGQLVGIVDRITPCNVSCWTSVATTVQPEEWPEATEKVRLAIGPKANTEEQTMIAYLDGAKFCEVSLESLRDSYPGKDVYVVSDGTRFNGSAEVVFEEGKTIIYRIGANQE